MSRDFTPAERYWSNKTSGDNLWLQNIEIRYDDGKTVKAYTDEEQARKLRYPNLAVALCDFFLALYNACPEEKRETLLSDMENLQVKMQNAFEKGINAFTQCEVPEKMKDWFLGKLDPGFYDSAPNDQIYLDWCKKEIIGCKA